MKNGALLFLGIFAVMALSWGTLVMTGVRTFGHLRPHVDEISGESFPTPMTGLAEKGRQAYVQLGCVSCHTQLVRRPGYGADFERGWGDRQSVARDYVGQHQVHLGHLRIGPDLRNVGEREVPEFDWATWHHVHLYNPRLLVKGSLMPAFPFLYERRRIVGEPSPAALPIQTGDGYEIVPTDRATALLAYLRRQTLDYDLPEAEELTAEAWERRNEQAPE